MGYFRLGLLGYPLGHSLSPALHRAALQAAGLAGEYRLYPIPPEAWDREAPALVQALRQGRIQGLNVTIPYKRRVLAWLDDLTDAARACGAVNTLFLRQGRLVGENTDAPGFWADLTHRLPQVTAWPRPRAVLLGAGGAARAVAWVLSRQGWTVYVVARRLDQARELVQAFRAQGFASLFAYPWESRTDPAVPWFREPGPVLLVNATPVGMAPHVTASPWPEDGPWPREAAVYDLVYNPRETRLLQAARRAGLPAVDGLGMLVFQAAFAFARWTQVDPARVLPAMAKAVGLSLPREVA